MSRVNPLQIITLLFVIIAFLIFKLGDLKEDLHDTKEAYTVSKKLAVELNSLKSVYAHSRKSKASIERILAQRSLKATKFDLKWSKKTLLIRAKSIDTAALNSLMGKILNGSYDITILKIKRLSETEASLKMEIKW